MSRAVFTACAVWLLAACAGQPAQAPVFAQPAPGMAGVDDSRSSRSNQAAVLSTEVLPSLKLTATLVMESPMLQRPQNGSAVLKMLASGTVTELLGDLDNAEGQWLSVAVDGVQGWIRASAATR